jgi:hypothetical protein
MLADIRNCAFYALSVPAIKEERVNSVEDGNTNQCGAQESHVIPQSRGEQRQA